MTQQVENDSCYRLDLTISADRERKQQQATNEEPNLALHQHLVMSSSSSRSSSSSSNNSSSNDDEQLESSIISSNNPGSKIKKTQKPRRRVATLAQRRAANIRERRRMFNLNAAFDRLRKKVPSFAYEKRLSRIETLKLAIMYIRFMDDLLNDEVYAEKYKQLTGAAAATGQQNSLVALTGSPMHSMVASCFSSLANNTSSSSTFGNPDSPGSTSPLMPLNQHSLAHQQSQQQQQQLHELCSPSKLPHQAARHCQQQQQQQQQVCSYQQPQYQQQYHPHHHHHHHSHQAPAYPAMETALQRGISCDMSPALAEHSSVYSLHSLEAR